MDSSMYSSGGSSSGSNTKLLAIWAGAATIVAILALLFLAGNVIKTNNTTPKVDDDGNAKPSSDPSRKASKDEALELAQTNEDLTSYFSAGNFQGIARALDINTTINAVEITFNGEDINYSSIDYAKYIDGIFKVYEPTYYENAINKEGHYFGFNGATSDGYVLARDSSIPGYGEYLKVCDAKELEKNKFEVTVNYMQDCEGNLLNPLLPVESAGTYTREYEFSTYNSQLVVSGVKTTKSVIRKEPVNNGE